MVYVPGLYFVIAADDHARFVRPDPDDGLHTIQTVSLPAVRGCALGSWLRSRSASAANARFARLLAARIDEDFAVDKFTDLVLVAPPRLLRDLTESLGATTRESLFGSLAKNLATVPDLELWPYLRPWLQPVKSAWTVTEPS